MTSTFSVSDEVDEQRISVGAIRRVLAERVTPHPERPPRAQFVRGQADNVRTFTWPHDKFEVVQPDFRKWQFTRCHALPTS